MVLSTDIVWGIWHIANALHASIPLTPQDTHELNRHLLVGTLVLFHVRTGHMANGPMAHGRERAPSKVYFYVITRSGLP